MDVTTALFWTCCALLLYGYALYPLIMRVLAARFGIPVRRGSALPSVTMIIAAYNEEKCIRGKLDDIGRLDYPAELLQIIVVSDASSDATETMRPCGKGQAKLLPRPAVLLPSNAGPGAAAKDAMLSMSCGNAVDHGGDRAGPPYHRRPPSGRHNDVDQGRQPNIVRSFRRPCEGIRAVGHLLRHSRTRNVATIVVR